MAAEQHNRPNPRHPTAAPAICLRWRMSRRCFHKCRRYFHPNWPSELNRIATILNPIHEQIFEHDRVNYYWTTHQSEWAIDVRFPKQEKANVAAPP
jgi:hypothetical protein